MIIRTAFTGLILAASLLAHDPHDPIQCVAVSPNFANDQTVFAATGLLSLKIGVYALLQSSDGGTTWSVVPNLPNNSPILAVLFSPAYRLDKTVFVAGGGGLFQSKDRGATWVQLESAALQALALSSEYDSRGGAQAIFAISAPTSLNPQGQVLSSKNGQPLTAVSVQPSSASAFTSLAVTPGSFGRGLVVGTALDGIFASANAGAAWSQEVKGQASLGAVNVLAYSPAFPIDQTIFAGTSAGGVLVTTNGGTLWSRANHGLADLNVVSLALSPSFGTGTDHTLWAATADQQGKGGIFQSAKAGAAWSGPRIVSRALDQSQTVAHYQSIAVGAAKGGDPRLYLGMYEGLWQASGSAAPFQYIETIPGRLIRYVNLSPDYATRPSIFANTYGGGNLWSSDAGVTWGFENTGMQYTYTDASGFSPNFVRDGIAFSGDRAGLEKLVRGSGEVWAVTAPAGGSIYPRAIAISPHFATDCRVLVGTSTAPGGVYAYTDTSKGCQNSGWSANLLPGKLIYSIALSPDFSATTGSAFAAAALDGTLDETIGAVASSGIYKSADGGQTWAPLTNPVLPQQMAVVAVTPTYLTDGGVVYAAACNGGLYRSPDGGVTWSVVPGSDSIRAMSLTFSASYATDGILYAGTVQRGLMQSTNGGALADVVPLLGQNFVTAAASAPDGSLFAATYHGLYKLSPGAPAWTYRNEPVRVEESANALPDSHPPLQPPIIVYCSAAQGCLGTGGWEAVLDTLHTSAWYAMQTTATGDYATFAFTGAQVSWIASGKNLGTATVTVDDGAPCTVALNPGTAYVETAVWSNLCGSPCAAPACGPLTCGRHTVTVTNESQAVSIDAFQVWSSGCLNTSP